MLQYSKGQVQGLNKFFEITESRIIIFQQKKDLMEQIEQIGFRII